MSSEAAAKAKAKKEMRADFLLNFQRPQASRTQQNYAPPPRRHRPTGTRATSSSFSKGQFVQSSFRILVDEITSDVVEATLNADALVDWASLRRVDFKGEELLKCPICLEEQMVVPKITRCGHVFCAPCVMRYFLALQEYNGKFWQKCPVCNNEKTSPEEMVSVRFEPAKAPREGDRLRLVLARRAASSTVVRPPPMANPTTPVRGSDEAPWSLPFEGQEGWRLSRLVRLPSGASSKMIEEEIAELAAYRVSCLGTGDTELFPSIDAAIKCLEQLRTSRATKTGSLVADPKDSHMPPLTVEEVPGSRPNQHGKVGESSLAQQPNQLNPQGASSSCASRGNPSHTISFYTSDDGRLIFLQPLFTRLLLHEHGGWDSIPLELSDIRVQKVVETTLCEETKRRHRFLSHLPLGSQFCFVEVDLRSEISLATKEHFAEEFERLRQQHKRDLAKSKREDRVSKNRAEKEEEKYFQAMSQPAPFTVAPQTVPTKDDFVPLPGHNSVNVAEDVNGDGNGTGADEIEETSGPTLAEKLKFRMAAKSKPTPAKAKPTSPPLPPPGSSAWGPALGASKSPVAKKAAAPRSSTLVVKDSWEDSTPEGTPVLGPAVAPLDDNPTLGQALDNALRSRGTSSGDAAEQGDAVPCQAGNSSGKKKKGRAGKAQTIRLFG